MNVLDTLSNTFIYIKKNIDMNIDDIKYKLNNDTYYKFNLSDKKQKKHNFYTTNS